MMITSLYKNSLFIIFFPAFLIYHFLLAYELIPPFLRGYLGIISLILFVPVSITFFNLSKKSIISFNLEDKLFFIFLLYFLIIISLNFALGANELILFEHLMVIVEFYVVYFIFKQVDINDEMIYIISLAVVFLLPFFIFNVSHQFIGGIGEIATYQDIAFFFIVILMILLTKIKKSNLRFLIYLNSAVMLFLVGARSELGAFLIIFLLNELYLSQRKVFMLLSLFVLSVICMINIDKIVDALPENRNTIFIQVILSNGLQEDGSQTERNELMTKGLDTIANYPIFGNYASYQPGNYVHNILSAWVDLGIIGLMFILLFVTIPIFYVMKLVFINNIKNEYLHFLLFLSFLVFIMIFFAKSFGYLGLPILWAIFSKARQYNRNKEIKNANEI